jgi:hypothetical protein
MADAALEGMASHKETMDEAITDIDGYDHEDFDGMEDAEDEVLLGESTLAKLRDAEVEETKESETKEKLEDSSSTEDED